MSILESLDRNIKVITITGGPCGGKTSGMAYLRDRLSQLGYRVLVAPEVATKLIAGGITPNDSAVGFLQFQKWLVADLVSQEETFIKTANYFSARGEKVVVLMDRGGIEGIAYLKGDIDTFRAMASELGWHLGDLCEGRYHAVIHMVTAAIGAESHYSFDNPARYESLEYAQTIDGLIVNSWLRHPHLRVIDNSTDFATKLERVFGEVKGILGEPEPLETEDRYLVETAMLPPNFSNSWIKQDYLLSKAGEPQRRVRKRESDDGYVMYYETRKGGLIDGSRKESEQIITHEGYDSLLALRDPESAAIIKRRCCFLYKGRFFELDRFHEPINGLMILEVERLPHESKSSIELPPFVKIIADISDDPRYSNRQIAINRSIPKNK